MAVSKLVASLEGRLDVIFPTQDYINASLSMISFFPDRSQWNDYEKENDYIHYESSQHFLRTRIRPVPRPYQEQRQEYYRREEDNEPLHWRGRLHPFLYLGLHRSLIHDLHPLHMLILVWVWMVVTKGSSIMPAYTTVPCITPAYTWVPLLQTTLG